jgi:hypothetical protein
MFSITIGNLQPNEELQLEVELIGEVKSEDLSNKFFFPLFRIPKLIIEKQPLLLPDFFSRKNPVAINSEFTSSIPTTFNALYLSPSKITRFACPSHTNNIIQISEDRLIAQITIPHEEIYKSKSPEILILFRNEDVNIGRLYEEYDPKLNLYSYKLLYKVDEIIIYKQMPHTFELIFVHMIPGHLQVVLSVANYLYDFAITVLLSNGLCWQTGKSNWYVRFCMQ